MPVHLPVFTEEAPLEVTDDAGNVYRRTGYCNRCGSCCLGNYFEGDPSAPKPKIPGMCAYLDLDGEGLAVCTFRVKANTYWYTGCRLWPSPANLHLSEEHPQCSYKTELVRSGERF